jgi:hypothetical protein
MVCLRMKKKYIVKILNAYIIRNMCFFSRSRSSSLEICCWIEHSLLQVLTCGWFSVLMYQSLCGISHLVRCHLHVASACALRFWFYDSILVLSNFVCWFFFFFIHKEDMVSNPFSIQQQPDHLHMCWENELARWWWQARIALERRKFLQGAAMAVQRQGIWSSLAHDMTAEYRSLCSEEVPFTPTATSSSIARKLHFLGV